MSDFYCDEVVTGKQKVLIVLETDLVMAFHHTKPFFEHHIVIIPKKHIDSLTSLDVTDSDLAKDFMLVISQVATKLESEFGGCRVSSNVGSYQNCKHLHWCVHSGKRIRNEDGTHIEP